MYIGGLGQGELKPEEQMRAAEAGKLLAQTAQDIQAGLAAARQLNDANLIKTGESIYEDWKLAQMVALNWKDYAGALRTLGYIQTAINNWYARLREKGANVQFRGIYTPPPPVPTIFATLKQTAGEVAKEAAGAFGSEYPWWLLPAGAALVLFLLLKR